MAVKIIEDKTKKINKKEIINAEKVFELIKCLEGDEIYSLLWMIANYEKDSFEDIAEGLKSK